MEFTERLLRDAGVTAGMRVIDVGCGRGDVSFLLAQIVGDAGEVVGVDRDRGAVEAARDDARERDASRVSFVVGDFSTPPTDRPFDAVVGRRVLMYQRDQVDAVRQVARALRKGGIVVFQEHDSTMVPASAKPLPLHEQVERWIWQTVEKEGANIHMGFELASVLEEAGLVVEEVRAEAVIHTARAHAKGHHSIGTIVRFMVPRIVAQGVATEAELDVATLDERLLEERTRANAVFISDMMFGAWARKPA